MPRFFAVVACYLALCLGRALTTAPWNDEAWYASPSWSLITHGNTGTPLLEEAGHFWKGIHQVTYWVVPLQFFAQAPWFKLFGFSLLSARFFAVAWGLVGMLSWGLIVHKLTANPLMAFWTVTLLACDYQFVSQMSLDRMDAMALGLASLALLLYLQFRETNLPLAVFLSQACVAASGLTHPTAGVPALCALTFLTLFTDRARLRLPHLALAAAPYLIGAAFWYWYISAAPDLFKAQFFGNVVDIDRLGGFHHPLGAIRRELGRYAGMGGFQTGMHPLYRIKTLVVLVYAAAVVGLLTNRTTRRDPGVRALLWLLLVYAAAMTFYDNTKEVKYAVHLTPPYDAVAAAWIASSSRKGWVAAALFLAVSVGGLLYTTFAKDEYHRAYLPAADFIKQHARPQDLVLAGSEFGFALGFDSNTVDDADFGFYSRKTPQFIVIGENYRAFLAYAARRRPALHAYEQRLLHDDYEKVYSHAGYDILKRRPPHMLNSERP